MEKSVTTYFQILSCCFFSNFSEKSGKVNDLYLNYVEGKKWDWKLLAKSKEKAYKLLT